MIRSVHKYGGLLRASVASATNDHRLGANEAPPAIISIFLGDQLTDVFDQIAKGGATSSKEKGTLMIGVDTLPVLPTDPGDRNRTSPFAFTGNRFEFRAPGSLQSIAGPMVTINTILAEALDYIATELEAHLSDGAEFNTAVQKVLEEIITIHGSVVFNGDGYSEDWQVEAAARGLPNLRTTLDALPELVDGGGAGAVQPLRGLQPPRDAQPVRDRARAVRPQHRRRGPDHAGDGGDGRPAGGGPLPDRAGDERRRAEGRRRRRRPRRARAALGARSPRCARAWPSWGRRLRTRRRHRWPRPSTPATSCCRRWARCAAAADALEGIVADDLWPLPTYQEMLYIL